jgi:VanZ family protein
MLIGIHRTIEIKNKFIILFMKLLVYNIHCNPSKRMTIDLTIIKFDSLLDSLEPKDYKNVINGLMSA